MNIYSVQIGLVLLVILFLYWIKPRIGSKIQNILILLASYGCYSLWNWKLLALVIFITALNFFIGKAISASEGKSKGKFFLITNVIIHIGLFAFFRYFNFFIEDLTKIFSLLGIEMSVKPFEVIVPLGISIYTLQALSYSIEIFRNKIQPTKDIIAFSAYVSFFPQMLAGPVERATTLLPQFFNERLFNKESFITGLSRIIWGLFKIIVVANNCAIYSNEIFSNYGDYTGLTIFAGLIAFAFQFYADISGLSDIATGVARLFGFSLSANFKFPFFSKGFGDFWSKWNISLMTWLKEYVYLPLGGSDKKKWITFINLFVLFLLVGMWHGGNYSFILFGLINAILVIPSVLRASVISNSSVSTNTKLFPGVLDIIQYLITFSIIAIGLIFFRATSLSDAMNILHNLFTNIFSVSMLEFRSLGNGFAATLSNVLVLGVYVIIEWIQRDKEFALDFNDGKTSVNKKWIISALVLILILFFNQTVQEYVYFSY